MAEHSPGADMNSAGSTYRSIDGGRSVGKSQRDGRSPRTSYRPDKASLDARPLPAWYRDAKLGVFIHWALYSIPAFATPASGDTSTFRSDLTSGKDTKGESPYAEFYLNGLRVPGSAVARHHEATYGKDFSYFDFREQSNTNVSRVNFNEWAGLFAQVGARYVVMVSKHEDGFSMWPTKIANPHMPPDYRATRNLVGDLADAIRSRGIRMGLYYSGGVDWTFKRAPIRTLTDLMEHGAPHGSRTTASPSSERACGRRAKGRRGMDSTSDSRKRTAPSTASSWETASPTAWSSAIWCCQRTLGSGFWARTRT